MQEKNDRIANKKIIHLDFVLKLSYLLVYIHILYIHIFLSVRYLINNNYFIIKYFFHHNKPIILLFININIIKIILLVLSLKS